MRRKKLNKEESELRELKETIDSLEKSLDMINTQYSRLKTLGLSEEEYNTQYRLLVRSENTTKASICHYKQKMKGIMRDAELRR